MARAFALLACPLPEWLALFLQNRVYPEPGTPEAATLRQLIAEDDYPPVATRAAAHGKVSPLERCPDPPAARLRTPGTWPA